MSGLPIVWTQHLKTKEDKENFGKLLRNSTVVNSRLVDILYDKYRGTLETKFTDYDSPSWAYSQADQNGYRRALEEVLQLFKFMEK